MSLLKNENIRYTDDVLEFIIPRYKAGKWDEIFEKFPNTSKQSIYKKMNRIGVKRDNFYWTETEVDILKKNYNSNCDIHELSKLLPNKTYDSITTKAQKLGLKTREYWSDDEVKILIENYPKVSVDEICKMLPNRTRGTIIMKANSLHILNSVKFHDNEIQFIKDNWMTTGDKEIAKTLNRSEGSIQNKRLELGFSRYDIKSPTYDLVTYLRGNNITWKQNSMKQCDYKCVLTGERFDVIHHIYSFNLIFDELIKTYNIPIYENISLYSTDELNFILSHFLEIQSKYPLGVCLTKELHNEFHNKYGYGNNSIEQWEEFKNTKITNN